MRLLVLLVCVLAAVVLCTGKRPTSSSTTTTGSPSSKSHRQPSSKESHQAPAPNSGKAKMPNAQAGKMAGGAPGKPGKGGKPSKGAPKIQKNFQAGKPIKVKEVNEEAQVEKPAAKENEPKAPEAILNADLDKKTQEEGKVDSPKVDTAKDDPTKDESSNSADFDESLISTETATELASLRAELAAAKEMAGLRTAVAEQNRLKEKADKTARKAAAPTLRPPKAKKCLDVDFTGQEAETGSGTPVVLERCSCSCRPAALPTANSTDAAVPPQAPEAGLTSEEESTEQTPSLDQI